MKVSMQLLGLSLILGWTAPRAALADPADQKKVDFIKDVQPIFTESCAKCHGLDPDKPKKKPAAELRLDSRDAVLKGGRSGKVVVPGNAKDSLLFKLLHGPVPRPDKRENAKDIEPMPKVKKGEEWKSLPADKIETIRRWIDQGSS